MFYIYVQNARLPNLLAALKRTYVNDQKTILSIKTGLGSAVALGTSTLVCKDGNAVDFLTSEKWSGKQELENNGSNVDVLPFLAWDGLDHIHPRDREIVPTAEIYGKLCMVMQHTLSIRLANEYAVVRWFEFEAFESVMDSDLQVNSELRRRIFGAIQSDCPEAKVVFRFEYDGVDNLYKFTPSTGTDCNYEELTYPAEQKDGPYDIDEFVNTFDGWTELSTLSETNNAINSKSPSTD